MDAVVSLLGLSPRYVGGSETYAKELSQQLAEHNWRSILCFLEEPPEAVRSYLQLPNVSIEVVENAVELNLSALRKVAEILLRYRPKIFHMQLVGFIGFYPWLARLFFVKRVLFTDQGSHPSNYVASRAPFWKRIAVRLINLPLSRIVCISKYNYNCFITRDVLPARRFEVIYNSADFSRLGNSQERRNRFRNKYGIPENRTVILQVSWIIPEKGIPDLLKAASLIVEQNKNVHLVLAGDGAYREHYMEMAADLELSGHITWTGLVTDPFIEGVYDAADVVCQVSRWQEAFGQTIAEAMACNKPVVATRVGGIPELIDDGRSGFVVEAGNVEAIADRLLLLIRDDELRERMGRHGHLLAREKFDLRKNVRRLLELYGLSHGQEQI